jgi:carotenoid cleavage dioxygenase-like enzyme
MVFAENIIIPTAITIAITITGISSAMPTAVMTESNEKTISIMAICARNADQSSLVILDARDVEMAPVAKVKLPRRVPYGAHGNWLPDA